MGVHVVTVGPTTRRRQLGATLRRLREEKGLSLEEAGAAVGLSKATLSRYETKEGGVKWPVVDALCRMYDAGPQERAYLVDLTKNAKVQGWWQSYTDVIPERMSSLVTLENEAARLDHFARVYIPGLHQTHSYAEALHRTTGDSSSEEAASRSLAVRMKRQEILSRPNPVEHFTVLDESVIRRVIGGSTVMREQLARLIDNAEQPHVDIQVLPFASAAQATAMGSFIVLVGADPSLDVVYMENLTVSLYIEKAEEVEKYRQAFHRLREHALSPEDSIKLIKKTIKEY